MKGKGYPKECAMVSISDYSYMVSVYSISMLFILFPLVLLCNGSFMEQSSLLQPVLLQRLFTDHKKFPDTTMSIEHYG